MDKMKIIVNYDEALFLSAAITYFLKNENIKSKEDWPKVEIEYLIGQVQEVVEKLGGK